MPDHYGELHGGPLASKERKLHRHTSPAHSLTVTGYTMTRGAISQEWLHRLRLQRRPNEIEKNQKTGGCNGRDDDRRIGDNRRAHPHRHSRIRGPPLLSYIHNSVNSSVDIGVVYDMDDGGAVYDAILPQDRRTDRHLGWAHAEGFYIGSLYCADSYYQQDGVEFRYHYREQGQIRAPRIPFTMDTDGVARWRVITYRC